MRVHGTRDEAGHQPHRGRCGNGADRTAAGAFHDVRGNTNMHGLSRDSRGQYKTLTCRYYSSDY